LLGHEKTREFVRLFYQEQYSSSYDFAAQMDEAAVIRALSMYSSAKSRKVPIGSDLGHHPLFRAAFEDLRIYVLKDPTTLAALERMKVESPQEYELVNAYLNGEYRQYDQDAAQRVIDALEAWHWATRFSDLEQFQPQFKPPEKKDPQTLLLHYSAPAPSADSYLDEFTSDYQDLYQNSRTQEALSAICRTDKAACEAMEQIRGYYEQADLQTLDSSEKDNLVRALVVLNQVSSSAVRDAQEKGVDQVQISTGSSNQLQKWGQWLKWQAGD
jgi:hypothetical protein